MNLFRKIGGGLLIAGLLVLVGFFFYQIQQFWIAESLIVKTTPDIGAVNVGKTFVYAVIIGLLFYKAISWVPGFSWFEGLAKRYGIPLVFGGLLAMAAYYYGGKYMAGEEGLLWTLAMIAATGVLLTPLWYKPVYFFIQPRSLEIVASLLLSYVLWKNGVIGGLPIALATAYLGIEVAKRVAQYRPTSRLGRIATATPIIVGLYLLARAFSTGEVTQIWQQYLSANPPAAISRPQAPSAVFKFVDSLFNLGGANLEQRAATNNRAANAERYAQQGIIVRPTKVHNLRGKGIRLAGSGEYWVIPACTVVSYEVVSVQPTAASASTKNPRELVKVWVETRRGKLRPVLINIEDVVMVGRQVTLVPSREYKIKDDGHERRTLLTLQPGELSSPFTAIPRGFPDKQPILVDWLGMNANPYWLCPAHQSNCVGQVGKGTATVPSNETIRIRGGAQQSCVTVIELIG